MFTYTTAIKRFNKNGEKTGWTYIDVPEAIAEQLKPGNRQSFRVKGKLDNHSIKQIALLPVGEGNFILPLNAATRKFIGKPVGAILSVELAEDKSEFVLNPILMECLADEPAAMQFFNTLTPGHQRYFSKWIDEAKTETTTTKRTAIAVSSLAKQMDYGTMLRSQKKDNAG